jgi:hypothetical protein
MPFCRGESAMTYLGARPADMARVGEHGARWADMASVSGQGARGRTWRAWADVARVGSVRYACGAACDVGKPGVDPVSWTPNLLREERSPRWERDGRIRRSTGST